MSAKYAPRRRRAVTDQGPTKNPAKTSASKKPSTKPRTAHLVGDLDLTKELPVRTNKDGRPLCVQVSADKKQFCRMVRMDGQDTCRRHTEEGGKISNPELQCTAMSSFNQERCRKLARRGLNVCAIHGGSSPQVIKRLEHIMLMSVDPAFARIVDIANQDDHLPTAFKANEFILNKAIFDKQKAKKEEGGNTSYYSISMVIGGIPGNPVLNPVKQITEVSETQYVDAEVAGTVDDEEDE